MKKKIYANTEICGAVEVKTTGGGRLFISHTIGNLTVTEGTHVFFNCAGELTVSGTAARIYVTNCPNLTVKGKTASNWTNIWVDGVASVLKGEGIIRYADGTQIIRGWTNSDAPYVFPVAFFEDSPHVALGPTYTESPAYVAERSLTGMTIRGYTGYSSTDFIAVGRWK